MYILYHPFGNVDYVSNLSDGLVLHMIGATFAALIVDRVIISRDKLLTT